MTGRLIRADAAPFERFRAGDTVAHITMGDGVVKGVEYDPGNFNEMERVIVVRYARGGTGRYNDRWFALNPRALFHRGEITPLGATE